MRSAFTLIELIISMGIIAAIVSFSSINLLSTQRKTTLNEQVEIVITDIRSQQIKAMSGDTGGTGTTTDYGIYLANNAYILFRGSTYSPVDPDNYQVELPPTLSFTDVAFSGSQIVFQKGSGEILSFDNAAHSFSLTDSGQGDSKTFTLNALGIITDIQ